MGKNLTEQLADTLELPTREPAKTPGEVDIPSSLVQLDVAARTHAGKVRPNNEDQFLVARLGRDLEVLASSLPQDEAPLHSRETAYGMVVADGMGGEAGGEVASRLAIKTLLDLVIKTPDWLMRLNEELAAEFAKRATRRYREADAAIRDEARAEPALSRMGTTMTLATSLAADLFVVHVGDSRAYLFRAGQLRQLTRDQTVVQALVDAGALTREQAAAHNLRHVLTQALGQSAGELRIEVERLKLESGDCLLLCTDGLTDMLTDSEIAGVLAGSDKADDNCRELVARALDAGGKDNVTVIVARYSFPRI